ncbi:hypothetical protein MGYG_08834 [Nannizzia gypsea CBS 118893]|uniref:Uncharacterized protein n=1 Tax=Arthroderma gypseum (strain ATCC MYA-4604 / CBS 118893) TaxID=535722 RepID=E4V744_ARTGP|nr:hypothetical protein MGYG_08834 [Nannizzia gypsea CBS 118893]EFQ96910.1 hypothetical protein MGYG_08834 [Nannizzia gypsea CBS 118893]
METVGIESKRAEEIQQALEIHINQRNNYHQCMSAIAIRFEDDDTGAATDTKNFTGLMAVLGIRTVEECVLQAADKAPAWTLNGRLNNHLRVSIDKSSPDKPGRVLLIAFYAGHGFNDPCHGLTFGANPRSRTTMRFSTLAESMSSYVTVSSVPVDIVFIVDCCGAAAASLRPCPITGTFEVLAAVSEDQIAFGSSEYMVTRRTFTAKLAQAAAEVRGKAQSVDFAELLERAYDLSTKKFPVHKLLHGSVSVRVKFPTPGTDTSSLSVAPDSPCYKVAFSCHICEDPDSTGVMNLLRWIDSLDASVGIKIEKVYRVRSTGILLLAPYSLFCTLRQLAGARPIFAYAYEFDPRLPSPSVSDLKQKTVRKVYLTKATATKALSTLNIGIPKFNTECEDKEVFIGQKADIHLALHIVSYFSIVINAETPFISSKLVTEQKYGNYYLQTQ